MSDKYICRTHFKNNIVPTNRYKSFFLNMTLPRIILLCFYYFFKGNFPLFKTKPKTHWNLTKIFVTALRFGLTVVFIRFSRVPLFILGLATKSGLSAHVPYSMFLRTYLRLILYNTIHE